MEAWLFIVLLLAASTGVLSSPYSSSRLNCDRQAQCIHQENLTCFGSPLNYNSTSLELVDDVFSVDEKVDDRVEFMLGQWKQALSQIPHCWREARSLLCSLYRPPCTNGSVRLASYEACKQVQEACSITALQRVKWPSFLQCEQDIFSKGCKLRPFKISTNDSAQCIWPLVPTTDKTLWFPEIRGCGLPCNQHPLLTEQEQQSIRSFVLCMVGLSAACCVCTLLVLFNRSKNYPARMTVFAAGSLLVVCLGYSAQVVFGTESILCNEDATLQQGGQPNFTCVAVFFACYYFFFVFICWFVTICYAWNKYSQSGDKRQDYWKDNHSGWWQLSAWGLPFILTIVVLGASGVEADSITGICYVTRTSLMRGVFVVVPTAVGLASAFYFLIRIQYRLVRLKSSQMDAESRKDRDYYSRRFGALLAVTMIISGFLMQYYAYELINFPVWDKSLREHFSCRTNVRLNSGDLEGQRVNSCDLKDKPSVAMLKMPFVLFFLICLAVFVSTLLSAAGVAFRKRLLILVLRRKPVAPATGAAQAKRKRNIAELFARRHEDEVEDEVASQNLSSTWSQIAQFALPSIRMVPRRYSSSSDVSRQIEHLVQSRKRKTRKERDRHRVNMEKTTSTGDLGGVTTPLMQPFMSVPVIHKENLINPPFTHGMSDEARQFRLYPFRSASCKPPSTTQPPIFTPQLQSIPFLPQPIYPMLGTYPAFPFAAYPPYFMPMMSAPPASNEFIPFPDVDNIKSPLIPLRAQETGSEMSFLIPQPSDIEYDTDFYRPQTAVPKDRRQPKHGEFPVPPARRNTGFMSS